MNLDLLDNKKNKLYQRAYPKLLSILLMASIVACCLFVIFIVLVMKSPRATYYAAMDTGKIKKIYSYSEPVLTDSYIREWSKMTARSMLNLNFENYESQLDKASQYFTPEAWGTFLSDMNKHGYLSSLKKSQLSMNSFVSGPVVIVFEGVINGQFVWKVQMPVKILFEGASSSVKNSWVVSMTIYRVPTVENPRAILVNSVSLG